MSNGSAETAPAFVVGRPCEQKLASLVGQLVWHRVRRQLMTVMEVTPDGWIVLQHGFGPDHLQEDTWVSLQPDFPNLIPITAGAK